MIVKGIPILHARTYNIDFRTGKLLTCPKPFDEGEATFCHRVAQDSTIFYELSPPEGRTVVYGNGKYLIVGKTVVFKDLYKRCGLPPKYVRVDNPKGRFAYGFAGAAFAIKDISEPFEFPDKTILKIYEHCIAARWDETIGSSGVRESTLSVPIELEVEKLTCKDRNMDARLQERGAKIAIEDTAENRKNVIYCVQQRVFKGEKISLCTSLATEKAITESCFDVVTCKGAASIRLDPNANSLSAPPKPTCKEMASGNDLDRFNVPKIEPRSLIENVGRISSPINQSYDNDSYRVNMNEPHISTSATKEQLPADRNPRKATSFTEEIANHSAPKMNLDVDSNGNLVSHVIKFFSGKKNNGDGGDFVKVVGFGAVGAILTGGAIVMLIKLLK